MTATPAPPSPVARLLAACLAADVVGETVRGDLQEEYQAQVAAEGRASAARWYRREAIATCAWAARSRFMAWRRRERQPGRQPMDSFRQDIRQSLRALRKQPGFIGVRG